MAVGRDRCCTRNRRRGCARGAASVMTARRRRDPLASGASLPRPGEYDVWRAVRQKLARVITGKAALVGAAAVAVAAVIGTTVGYAALGKHVTLNVDGTVEHVTVTGH